MPQPHPAEIVRAGAEVRGTQSFVHVMVSVWKRPSLTAIEVLWRWVIGLPSLWLIATCGWRIWLGATGGTADPGRLGLAHITVTDPFAAAQHIAFAGSQLLPPVLHTAGWVVPLLLAAWVSVAAVGRTAVLRRMDPSLPPRRFALLVLGALRIAFLTATVLLWLRTVLWAGATTVTAPTARGEEPNLVLYFTLIIAATLLIFIAWALTNWVLSIAPMLAALHNLSPWEAIRAATRLGPMRGKLIEINLVMGIVKVSLIVLALVFSSTPLPFESYTSAGFLQVWWAGVVLLYVLFSDYFHVVRAAVSLALCREYDARYFFSPPARKNASYKLQRFSFAARRKYDMSFAIYTIGTLILIGGLVYVAHLVHMPEKWIIACVLLILGAGIMGGVSSTRQKDPS